MPLHHLAVMPADVSGARLGLALNAPAPPPLVSCRLAHPDGGGVLLLGVLGASHVVVIEGGAESAGNRFTEEVSCTGGGHLPPRTDAPGYQLESHISAHGEDEFRALAQDLRARCAGEPDWLGGSFPGDDAALTALAAEPDGAGWRWQTWHLYPARPGGPSGGTVVHTASRWQP